MYDGIILSNFDCYLMMILFCWEGDFSKFDLALVD